MWITAEGNIYTGDCIPGDRSATASEVAAFMARNRQIPDQVTRFQAMAALSNAGLLAGVETMMQRPDVDEITRLAWQNALYFRRNSEMVLAMAGELQLTESQLDDLFVSAGAIE